MVEQWCQLQTIFLYVHFSQCPHSALTKNGNGWKLQLLQLDNEQYKHNNPIKEVINPPLYFFLVLQASNTFFKIKYKDLSRTFKPQWNRSTIKKRKKAWIFEVFSIVLCYSECRLRGTLPCLTQLSKAISTWDSDTTSVDTHADSRV